jgi:hypothetical protein
MTLKVEIIIPLDPLTSNRRLVGVQMWELRETFLLSPVIESRLSSHIARHTVDRGTLGIHLILINNSTN